LCSTYNKDLNSGGLKRTTDAREQLAQIKEDREVALAIIKRLDVLQSEKFIRDGLRFIGLATAIQKAVQFLRPSRSAHEEKLRLVLAKRSSSRSSVISYQITAGAIFAAVVVSWLVRHESHHARSLDSARAQIQAGVPPSEFTPGGSWTSRRPPPFNAQDFEYYFTTNPGNRDVGDLPVQPDPTACPIVDNCFSIMRTSDSEESGAQSINYGCASALWVKRPSAVMNGFRTEFMVQLSRGQCAGEKKFFTKNYNSSRGGDGFAFVFERPSDKLAVGSSGAGIGYAGLRNVLAIEFDNFPDTDKEDLWFFTNTQEELDPDGCHVALMRGSCKHTKDQYNLNPLGVLGPRTYTTGVSELVINAEQPISRFYVVIECTRQGDLTVQLGRDMNDLGRPLISTNISTDLERICEDGEARIGLTSGTGNAVQTVLVGNWTFFANEP
jgi:hypothetical protein